MDPFSMVVVIVIVGSVAGVINNAIKAKADARASRGADVNHDAELARVNTELTRLKDRVRVLEKIVTDNDHQLSEDIRRLA